MPMASQVPIFLGSFTGCIDKPIGMVSKCQRYTETSLRDVEHFEKHSPKFLLPKHGSRLLFWGKSRGEETRGKERHFL